MNHSDMLDANPLGSFYDILKTATDEEAVTSSNTNKSSTGDETKQFMLDTEAN